MSMLECTVEPEWTKELADEVLLWICLRRPDLTPFVSHDATFVM